MAQTRMKKIVWLVLVLLVIVVACFWIWHKRQPATSSTPAVATTTTTKPVKINTINQPTMGDPKAKIHIVAFEDLKCSNCMRFNTTLFPKIKKQYIDTGMAKYTMINLAFIPGSLPAANAARCLYVQNKKLFFPFVKYIYNHQPPENQNWATIPRLLEIAQKLDGVNMQGLKQCMVDGTYNGLIQNNLKEATKVMGPTVATPTIYVNGIKVAPLTMKNFKRVLKQAQK